MKRVASLILVSISLFAVWPGPNRAFADHDINFAIMLAGGNFDPVWSPDGRKVAYVSFMPDKPGQEYRFRLHITDLESTPSRKMIGEGLSPLWAPDGRLAFIREWTIWVVNVDSGRESRITTWRADQSGTIFAFWSFAGRPYGWSADGKQMVLVEANAIFIVNADGTGRRLLTNTDGNLGAGAVWTPDGPRIAFTSRGSSFPQISVINADGSGRRELTTDRAGLAPAWSPDGKRIAFLSPSASQEEYELYVMDADGGGQTRVARVGDISFPAWGKRSLFFASWPRIAWSPDGGRLAFQAMVQSPDAKKSIQIHIVNNDGTRLRQLTSGENYWAPSWSPDGRTLVFNGLGIDGRESNLKEDHPPIQIYAMNADGGELKCLSCRK